MSRASDTCGTLFHKHIITLAGEKRKNGAEKRFEEIMEIIGKLPKFCEKHSSTHTRSSMNSNTINTKISTTKHIIVKLSNVKENIESSEIKNDSSQEMNPQSY